MIPLNEIIEILVTPHLNVLPLRILPPELGYVSLLELAAVRGSLGLPIERDIHFDADKPLSAYADEARAHGRIVT